jgi:hypothetical protein
MPQQPTTRGGDQADRSGVARPHRSDAMPLGSDARRPLQSHGHGRWPRRPAAARPHPAPRSTSGDGPRRGRRGPKPTSNASAHRTVLGHRSATTLAIQAAASALTWVMAAARLPPTASENRRNAASSRNRAQSGWQRWKSVALARPRCGLSIAIPQLWPGPQWSENIEDGFGIDEHSSSPAEHGGCG